jgi:hypothetical protein
LRGAQKVTFFTCAEICPFTPRFRHLVLFCPVSILAAGAASADGNITWAQKSPPLSRAHARAVGRSMPSRTADFHMRTALSLFGARQRDAYRRVAPSLLCTPVQVSWTCVHGRRVCEFYRNITWAQKSPPLSRAHARADGRPMPSRTADFHMRTALSLFGARQRVAYQRVAQSLVSTSVQVSSTYVHGRPVYEFSRNITCAQKSPRLAGGGLGPLGGRCLLARRIFTCALLSRYLEHGYDTHITV